MATSMHRLQISLTEWQHQMLVQRARREGVSVAEVVRRLITAMADSQRTGSRRDPLLDIAGAGVDRYPPLKGVAVSEAPDLYLLGLHDSVETRHSSRPSQRRPATKRRARR